MYFGLLGINGKFFGKVAEKAYQLQQPQGNKVQTNAVETIASTILTIMLYVVCGIFAALLYKVPYVGILLSFVMNCAIYSYYCFE
jgi:hypothetical protein